MEASRETAVPTWQHRCAERAKSPEEAVARIHSGDRIFIGSGAAEPQRLVEVLVARAAVFGPELAGALGPSGPLSRAPEFMNSDEAAPSRPSLAYILGSMPHQ